MPYWTVIIQLWIYTICKLTPRLIFTLSAVKLKIQTYDFQKWKIKKEETSQKIREFWRFFKNLPAVCWDLDLSMLRSRVHPYLVLWLFLWKSRNGHLETGFKRRNEKEPWNSRGWVSLRISSWRALLARV